jgi:hypothetical protein
MHLPQLNPVLLQWCDLISDVVTTLASSGACILAAKLYWRKAETAIEKDVKEFRKS